MNVNGRSSLDPRWTQHHAKVVVGFMLAEIRVFRKVAGSALTYDQATRTYTNTDVEEIFSGAARIQPFGIIGDMVVGQDTTSRRLMRVQVEDLETGINIDDIVQVISSPDAPELETFMLEVRGTISSSNPWVTDLVCEADTKRNV